MTLYVNKIVEFEGKCYLVSSRITAGRYRLAGESGDIVVTEQYLDDFATVICEIPQILEKMEEKLAEKEKIGPLKPTRLKPTRLTFSNLFGE